MPDACPCRASHLQTQKKNTSRTKPPIWIRLSLHWLVSSVIDRASWPSRPGSSVYLWRLCNNISLTVGEKIFEKHMGFLHGQIRPALFQSEHYALVVKALKRRQRTTGHRLSGRGVELGSSNKGTKGEWIEMCLRTISEENNSEHDIFKEVHCGNSFCSGSDCC